MNAIDPSTTPTSDSNSISTSGSEPQGPVPAPCPQGHSPACPSSSAVGSQSARQITATYDPAEDKIRISASSRLDSETYERVKATGFAWAPLQKVFFAVWTPEREDLAVELAGDVDDETMTPAERAEARAQRFEGYQDRRAADAENARKAVAAVADNIPFGQPILVGHHSVRHARRDAEKIDNGMRRAIRMWETSEYWERRAAAALAHAERRERPDVRARRIKTLEAEGRKWQRDAEKKSKRLALWTSPDLTKEHAQAAANVDYGGPSRCYTLAEYPRQLPASQYEGTTSVWSALEDGIATVEQIRAWLVPATERGIAYVARWVGHIENRLSYERAMLGESGGLVADKFDFQRGGQVQRRGMWLVIAKVNKRGGQVSSLSVIGHFATTVSLDEVQDYRPPAEGAAATFKTKSENPILNYPGAVAYHYGDKVVRDEAVGITKAELARVQPEYKGTRMSEDRTHRIRVVGKSDVRSIFERRGQPSPVLGPGYGIQAVYLTDSKQHARPGVEEVAAVAAAHVAAAEASGRAQLARTQRTTAAREAAAPARAAKAEKAAPFEAMKQSLRQGDVQVVTVPQLFPTPAELAARMVAELAPKAGDRILEPSVGTGSLLRALAALDVYLDVVPVDIEMRFAHSLIGEFPTWRLRVADFLALAADGELAGNGFDGVLMNPPFANGQDIAHIRHALKFLVPGGALVALCADGPRQREQLRPEIEAAGGTWESLGDVGFAGTSVKVALLIVRTPPA